MFLCKKIKIEVGQQDAVALEFMQAKCCGLYNWFGHVPAERAKKPLRESKQYDRSYGMCMESSYTQICQI